MTATTDKVQPDILLTDEAQLTQDIIKTQGIHIPGHRKIHIK